MQLTDRDLTIICEAAVSAALKAGNLISSYSEKDLEVKNKGVGDTLASQVVTEVDVMAQDIILSMLAKVTKLFDLGTLGEESPDNYERFEKDYFWAIDPIDGTLAFINREPGYSTSIALVSKSGEPVIGVIFDPVSKTIYQAIKGQGAYLSGRKWIVEEEANTPLAFMNGNSFLDHTLRETTLKEMEKISLKLGYPAMTETFGGGAAMIACRALEMAPSCYITYPKKIDGGGSIWDFAASACIYAEAGAWVSNIYGQPLDLNRKDSTYMSHEGVLYASNPEIASEIKAMHNKLKLDK